MKYQTLLLLPLILLAACTSPPVAPPPAPEPKREKPVAQPKVEPKVSQSYAATANAYKREIAQHISQNNLAFIYTERPQALLRAVIVLKFSISADGKLLQKEIVRTNRDKGAETTALTSITNAAPFPRPAIQLVQNGKIDVTETWLFNNDGRFQLRTIALPQIDE